MAKSKYKDIHCSYCKRVTRMSILKEPEDNKGWFECSRCRHSFFIDLSFSENEKKEEKEILIKEDCLTYSPTNEYSVGDPIYHTEWDDIGKIEAKKKLSNGSSSIIVKFEKSGTKSLIEKLKADEGEANDNGETIDESVQPTDIDQDDKAKVKEIES